MNIDIYGRENCPFCTKAVELCHQQKLNFSYHDVQKDEAARAEMFRRVPDARTVPQIFAGDLHIGGFTDLEEAVKSGLIQQIIGGK